MEDPVDEPVPTVEELAEQCRKKRFVQLEAENGKTGLELLVAEEVKMKELSDIPEAKRTHQQQQALHPKHRSEISARVL
jgi:hypothetical protein